MLEPINTIISVVGLILGSSSLFILWWKRHKRTFLIYDLYGCYEASNAVTQGFTNITATLDVAFFNDSDETVSVTDILGTMKYDKERFKGLEMMGARGVREVFSANPANLEQVVPFNVLPHESVKKQLTIEFPKVVFEALYRMPTVRLLGFLEGKMPLYVHDESEFKEKWIDNPPTMLLTVHVNAKREFRRYIQLFKKGSRRASGTFWEADARRIEIDFREKG
jgi:hypothetical protein